MQRITVNGRPYRVVKLLGKGKGGYSYLAQAEQPGAELCVVKQIHHEPCPYYQFGDKLAAELADYDRLRAVGVPMPALLEVDRPAERLVKQYIPGDTVYQLVLRDALPPACAEQMRALCRKLYAAGLNIDYFPTNFIPHGGELYYVDYECNAYMEQWDFEHWGARYWAKTPEFLQYAAEHP